ncbi:MAG: CRISPR-associated endonuclease Cas2 [Oscillospiraceae bacterium]
MMVLITYDVNTQTKEGRRRLNKVARKCVNYGVRVQNSVFECVMDAAKCREVKQELSDIIDMDKDSLRFYYLGDKYKTKVEHIGAKESIQVEEPLIF